MVNRSAETLLRLTTLHRVKGKLGLTTLTVLQTQQIEQMIEAFSRLAAKIMGVGAYKKSRTEYHDVETGQSRFFVSGWPIDTSVTITAVNNADNPRTWTDSGDAISSGYIVCNEEMAERGEIVIEESLVAGKHVLKLVYTGGLASYTGSEGTDGVAASATFTSATSLFQTDGVAVGYILVVEAGANRGSWRISAVNSQTQVTCDRVAGAAAADPAFAFASQSATPFHILDSNSKSLITDWPEIADCVAGAIADYWRMKDGRMAVVSEAAGGVSSSYLRPYTMPRFYEDQLRGFAKGRRF